MHHAGLTPSLCSFSAVYHGKRTFNGSCRPIPPTMRVSNQSAPAWPACSWRCRQSSLAPRLKRLIGIWSFKRRPIAPVTHRWRFWWAFRLFKKIIDLIKGQCRPLRWCSCWWLLSLLNRARHLQIRLLPIDRVLWLGRRHIIGDVISWLVAVINFDPVDLERVHPDSRGPWLSRGSGLDAARLENVHFHCR